MLATVPRRRQKIAPHAAYPRHLHGEAYAAIVIAGGYVEAGSRGRWRVRAGDVLLHGAFDAHLDRFGHEGCEIVNLALPSGAMPGFGAGRVGDLDAILRAPPRDAGRLLRDKFHPREDCERDWPDLLAQALRADQAGKLADWARNHGIRGETLSRGFLRCYGVTPGRFRAEARTRRALAMIVRETSSLAAIAAAAGFSDQPHMTRQVLALTGRTPAYWRQIHSRLLPGTRASSRP